MNFKTIISTILIFSFLLFIISCGRNQAEDQQSKNNKTEGFSDSETSKRIPVEALVVKNNAVEQNIPLTGILKPLHSVDIVAEVSGKVEKIYKKLGDAVTTKDTLAVIDDKIPLSQYRQAKSQVLSAENNLKIAQLNLQSDEELYKRGDISKLTYENSVLAVKLAEANHLSALAALSLMEKGYHDTRISSPISGLISRKYIELGTMVMPNMPLYRVVDLTTLKIEVGISQATISHVILGSLAKVKISALNNKTVNGTVRYISPQADENTGAFTTEIHVKNTDEQSIRAGMTAKIDLILTDIRQQLTIPDHALVSKNGNNYVYKISRGTARLTDISITETIGSQVVIEDGLSKGDTIVVVGMKNLGVDTKVWLETVH